MILGLGKRFPSVEDEGIISNMIIKQIKQIFACRNIDGIWKEKYGERDQ